MKIKYQTIRIKFYNRLSKFLLDKSQKYITHKFIDRTNVKDLIEAFGIPHTEVDVILVNKKSVTFNYLIKDGDKIEVFPNREKVFVKKLIPLKPKIIGKPKFIADVHLGGLVKLMRMFGLDVLYNNNYTDDEIVEISKTQKRIILTRDIGLLKRKNVKYGHFIFGTTKEEQFKETCQSFDLIKYSQPLSLCLECGTKLKRISHKKALERLKDFKFDKNLSFHTCEKCNKIYWEGSHYDKMKKKIQTLKIYLKHPSKPEFKNNSIRNFS